MQDGRRGCPDSVTYRVRRQEGLWSATPGLAESRPMLPLCLREPRLCWPSGSGSGPQAKMGEGPNSHFAGWVWRGGLPASPAAPMLSRHRCLHGASSAPAQSLFPSGTKNYPLRFKGVSPGGYTLSPLACLPAGGNHRIYSSHPGRLASEPWTQPRVRVALALGAWHREGGPWMLVNDEGPAHSCSHRALTCGTVKASSSLGILLVA